MMICTHCGNTVGEGDIFCAVCGTSTAKEQVCSKCGQKLPLEALFCTHCGNKLGAVREADTAHSSSARATGRQLRKMMGVTKFHGEPVVGVANKLGTLTVYDDRVEFVRKAGLNLLTTAKALADQQVETYYYNDCASITNGTYMGVFVTLVLELKNGQKVSFCPALPVSKDMQTVNELILHYV